jgi:hypothetical protein
MIRSTPLLGSLDIGIFIGVLLIYDGLYFVALSLPVFVHLVRRSGLFNKIFAVKKNII